MKNIGYEKPLYILPFDHRGFFKKAFGFSEKLNEEERLQIIRAKELIFDGVERALAAGLPHASTAILVDEEFGKTVFEKAKHLNLITCLTVEKSGTAEFEFEYGEHFFEHLEKHRPSFAKALVRYNPDDSPEKNARQREKLRSLSETCRKIGIGLLIEPLIPPTEEQLTRTGSTQGYDRTLRPALTVRLIRDFQKEGIEADVWKIEGFEEPISYENAVLQAQTDGRQSGLVVLGRGEKMETIEQWLKAASHLPGVIGFAVGRSIFWQPLNDWRENKIPADVAAEQIAAGFFRCYTVFTNTPA